MRFAVQPIGRKKSNAISIFTKFVRGSLLAAKSAADVPQELKTDIRIGVVAEICAAEIERTGGYQIGTSVLRVSASRR
jgi:hypothetical protein